MKPRIVEQYDGGDIVLCAEEGIVTSPKQFPELSDHVGEDLIVTDAIPCWELTTKLVLRKSYRLWSTSGTSGNQAWPNQGGL